MRSSTRRSWNSRWTEAALAVLVLLTGAAAGAHPLDDTATSATASVVTVRFADGRPFSFEEFEVLGPGDRAPFQVGRTDREGRAVFLPDRPGEWTVKIWSDDGHGVQRTVTVDASLVAAPAAAPGVGRGEKVAVGAGLILALFGALFLVNRRRTP